MQPGCVVVSDKTIHSAACIITTQRCRSANTATLHRPVITLDLPVTLRIKRAGADVCHAGDLDKGLKVIGDELWSVVGDDAWFRTRKLFRGFLQQYLEIGGIQLFADRPVHNSPGKSIDHGGRKTEGSADIDVGSIHVPMLVSCEWLLETFALFGFLAAR